MATNKQMLAQIKRIKEGLTDQSEKESNIIAETETTSNVSKWSAVEQKGKEMPSKCNICEYRYKKKKLQLSNTRILNMAISNVKSVMKYVNLKLI